MTRMGTRPHDYVLRHAGHAVEVTYKPIRSLRLRVVPPDGRLRASVPAQFDESVVRRFIDDNLAWIATAQQKVRMRAPLVEPLVDGGRAKLWGEWRELRVAEADRASARVQGGLILKNGETRTVRGITVTAVPAYNLVHHRDNGEPFHPRGVGNGYLLDFGDTRLYVAGDPENTPEMAAPKDVDTAFLPTHLPSTFL